MGGSSKREGIYLYRASCNGPRTSAPAVTDRAQVWLWGPIPHSMSGVTTNSCYRLQQCRNRAWEEFPQTWGQELRPRGTTQPGGQGPRPRGATPPPRRRAQDGQEELLHFKVRRGSCEKIPLLQAALCWSSCEVIPHVQGKRHPSNMVGVVRGHKRADTLQP